MECHDLGPGKSNGVVTEFVCEDCGDNVFQYGYHDGISVCQVCRFIRTVPEMDEATKRILRGQE